MKNKYFWVIVLVMHIISLYQAKGQELSSDTIRTSPSMQEKRDLQQQSDQPSLHSLMPELWNSDNDFQEISVNSTFVPFDFKRELKYANNISEDASSLFVPVYPGLGHYQNFGGTVGSFNITNRLVSDYGAFISAQSGFAFSSKQMVVGGHYLMRYEITNNLQFQTWGQFIMPGKSSDPIFKMRTFFPTSNFGTGLQYDSYKKTKINVGIEYQYDQLDKTWKPESGGKIHIKF